MLTKEQQAQFKDLLRATASADNITRVNAQDQLAIALTVPLRETIYSVDTTSSMFFTPVYLDPEAAPEFPLSPIGPGEEDNFIAYTNPGHGYIPQRQTESDFVMVPTYGIANAIDWLLKHARQGRMDIVDKALKAFRWGFSKKLMDDGWRTVIAAAIDRNMLIFDADATQGQFTKRLVSLTKLAMLRGGGGNASSLNAARLTDLFMSVEGIEDIRNWGLDQIDDISRREIYLAADGSITRVFGVNLHGMTEFGVGSEYQKYFSDDLGGTLASGDVELAIGVDLSTDDCFYMPVKQELEVYPDPTLHRWQKAGYYGTQEQGFAVLDNRRVICLSY